MKGVTIALQDAHAALDVALVAHDSACVNLDAARAVLADTLSTALDAAHQDAVRDARETGAAADLEVATGAVDKKAAVSA